MISDKKAIESAKTIAEFCQEQRGCQNCVLRKFGADHWDCHIQAFDLRDVVANAEAKRKNRGWL